MPEPTNNRAPCHASAYAPGRVELLGNHTDYNEGLVLGAAIDRGLTMTGSSRADDMIVIRSETRGEIQVDRSQLRPRDSERWANYPLGVASELLALNVPIRGFFAEVSGNLLAGSGLSSSAAFELATALFLLKLYPHDLARLEIAKACQRAEHRFAGVRSGLLDQVVSLFGRVDQAVFFDARSEEVCNVPFPKDLALIIADSGKRRELTKGDYNARRNETHAAAEALGVRALRDVTSADLAQRHDLPDLLRRRATHVVGENERVWEAARLLRAGDGPGFGVLMNASHESSRTNFENSTPELDLLVAIARQLSGVLGARLTGAGFGGAIVSLCVRTQAEAIASALSRRYVTETGIASRVFITRVADGAS